MAILLFILALTQVPCEVVGQSEWSLQAEGGKVKVYVRPETGGDMSVRVMATATTNVLRVREVLNDCDAYPNWVHRCARAYILPGGTENEFIYFSHIDMPFPFSDREVVAQIWQAYDGDNDFFYRDIKSTPEALPPNDGRERLDKYDARWEVSAIPGGLVNISCTVTTSAGSGLPNWLRREIMTGGPAKTVRNLVARLETRVGK